MDCDVCQEEEAKSKTLKLNKTKILQKEIIPSNHCWICDLTFQDGEAQAKHFLDGHECQFCYWQFFEDPQHFSEDHVCDHCGEIFKNKYYKEDHIIEKHKADNKAVSVATTYEQSTSDQKTSKPRAGRKNRKVCSIQ